MKIENNAELNLNKKVDKQSSRAEFEGSAIGDPATEGLAERADFASVLDRVTKSHDQSRPREHTGDSTRTTEPKSRKEDDDQTRAAAVGQAPEVARGQHVEAPLTIDTHSILPDSDLQKIVTACQVQLTRSGQPEVLVELSRSVLEGLKVKVRADAAGRITAEFLTTNEGVKSLLDSRSSELMTLMRSRGINLAEFKSSVAADTNTGRDGREDRNAASQVAGTDKVRGTSTPTVEEPEIGQAASGSTYRA